MRYKVRVSWLGNHRPMDYLVSGDQLEIKGKTFTVKAVYQWEGRRVVETDHGVFFADELVRI